MQENLKAKYGITDEEFRRAVDQIKLNGIVCNGMVLAALCDLLRCGDIARAGQENFNSENADIVAMKGCICVTLNENELVFIPVQNIEYIGYYKPLEHVEINLSVGSQRTFAIKESIDEVKALIAKARN